jgi:ribokinase
VTTDRRWDVLGVGDADIDIYLRVPHVPDRDEKVLGTLLGEFPGGVVANFCCAASKAGARVGLASLVGDDAYGRQAIAALEDAGVDTSLVVVKPDGRTYFCVVLLDESGEKALTVVATDCISPRREDLDPETFGQARLIHLMASDLALTTWIAQKAKARGTLVSLDVEPTTVGSPAEMAALMASVDLAFPNAAGMRQLYPGDHLEGARALLAMGPSVVVVTLGAEGCLVVSEHETIRLPGIAVNVVDTTGAGDCFNGTFVAGYLQGWALERCAQVATAAAAISVTGVSSRGALASLGEVERFLEERGGAI